MKNTKSKKVRFYTPCLPCKYPRLTRPDTTFKAEGEYSVQLVATPEQAADIEKMVMPEVEAQVAELRKEKAWAKWKPVLKIKDELDADTQEPTGKKVIKFEQTARVEREGKEPLIFGVTIVDSKGKKLDEAAVKALRLGSGSEGKVCFTVRVVPNKLQSNFSVKFHPSAYQLITLREYAAADGSDGFEAVDEGFEAEEPQPVEAGATTGGSDQNPDF